MRALKPAPLGTHLPSQLPMLPSHCSIPKSFEDSNRAFHKQLPLSAARTPNLHNHHHHLQEKPTCTITTIICKKNQLAQPPPSIARKTNLHNHHHHLQKHSTCTNTTINCKNMRFAQPPPSFARKANLHNHHHHSQEKPTCPTTTIICPPPKKRPNWHRQTPPSIAAKAFNLHNYHHYQLKENSTCTSYHHYQLQHPTWVTTTIICKKIQLAQTITIISCKKTQHTQATTTINCKNIQLVQPPPSFARKSNLHAAVKTLPSTRMHSSCNCTKCLCPSGPSGANPLSKHHLAPSKTTCKHHLPKSNRSEARPLANITRRSSEASHGTYDRKKLST